MGLQIGGQLVQGLPVRGVKDQQTLFLIHEAAIGQIAGDQLLKLETLGLTPEEAEEKILEGFLA